MSGNHAKPSYGYLAQFETAEALTAAIRKARAAGYADLDAFSPFPLEEASEALGAKDRSVAIASFIGGLIGGAGGYFMEYYAMALDYPINAGGRPYNSWPSFMPIIFELTVLGATLAGLVAFLIANGLPMPHHPVFNAPQFSSATDDKFFLCIPRSDPLFSTGVTRMFLYSLAPVEVVEIAG